MAAAERQFAEHGVGPIRPSIECELGRDTTRLFQEKHPLSTAIPVRPGLGLHPKSLNAKAVAASSTDGPVACEPGGLSRVEADALGRWIQGNSFRCTAFDHEMVLFVRPLPERDDGSALSRLAQCRLPA